jgi:hypothetical protein
MLRNFALIISQLFNPFFEIPLIIVIAVFYAYFNGYEWEFLTLLLLIDTIIPALFYYHLVKRHEIHDWDISDRKERYPLYGFTLAAHLVGIYFAFISHQYNLAALLVIFWMIGLAFFSITLFWKISVHGGVNAVLAAVIVMIFGTTYWWLFLFLVPIGWSRVYLKEHTITQFVAGSVLAAAMLVGGFFWFNL